MQRGAQEKDNQTSKSAEPTQLSASSSTPLVTEHTPLSSSFKLPIENPEKMHRGLIIGVIIGTIVLAFLSLGMWYLAKALSTPKQVVAVQQTPQTTSSIPEGWKKFTSKKFGVSFIAPEKWTVVEDAQVVTDQETGLDKGYWFTIKTPGDGSETYSIGLAKAVLNDVVKAHVKTWKNAGLTVSEKPLKWQNRTAVEVAAESDETKQKLVVVKQLFVQVGDYVATVPDAGLVSPDMVEGTVNKADYRKFVGSIKIDTKAVEAQANAKIELPMGKDVQLGAVTIPTGWKKLQSQKYGISFAMPSAWVMTEQYDGLNGAVLGLTVGTSKSYDNEMTIMVSETGLDAYTDQAVLLYTGFGGGVTTKTEKMKWQSYEARRVTVYTDGNQDTTSLFVGIGKYTYNLPDPGSDQSGVVRGKFDSETYKTFVETIRIDPAL